MATKAEILLTTSADLRGIRQTEAAFRSLNGLLSTTGRIMAAGGAFGLGALTVENLASQLTAAATAGVRFNATMEQTALGIAALFRTFDPKRFTSLDAALAASAGTLNDLKVAARTTTASFEELAQAYQAIAGPAFSAGIPIEKQIRLTTMLAQAVTGMGLPSWQIPQEGRSILTGTIGPDSQVARALGITNTEVSRAKAGGDLFGYLEKKLASFAEAGDRAGRTLSGAASNLKDTFAQVSGEAMAPVNEALKEALLALTQSLGSPEMASAMKGFASGIVVVADKLPAVAESLPKLAEAASSVAKVIALLGAIRLAGAGLSGATWLAGRGASMMADWRLSAFGAAFPGMSLFGTKLPGNLLASEAAAIGVEGRIARLAATGTAGFPLAGFTSAAAGTTAQTIAAMRAGFGLPFIGQAAMTAAGGYGLGNVLSGFVPESWVVGLMNALGMVSDSTAAQMLQTAFAAGPRAKAEESGARQVFASPMSPEDLKGFLALQRDQLDFEFRNKLVGLDDYLERRRLQIAADFKRTQDGNAYDMALQNLEQFAFEQKQRQRKEAVDGLLGGLRAPSFAGAQRGMFQSVGTFNAWLGSVNYQKAAVDVLQRIERLLDSNNQLLREGGV